MAIPTSIQDLSPTDELNSPAGTDAVGGNIDNFFRAHAGIIRRALSSGADIASAATINLPPEGSYFYVTGTATINTITGGHPGRVVLLHLANNAKLSNNANIITTSGGTITSNGNYIVVLVNVTANVWRVVAVEHDVRAALATINGSITSINSQIGTINTNIGTLQGNISTINSNINGINSTINGINTDISNIESRSINAGSGLSGGGSLSTSRTISLGTPSTITNSTTNSVTSTSHTHSLTLPSASTSTAGIIETATDAEAAAGSLSTRAVTPSNLDGITPYMIRSRAGFLSMPSDSVQIISWSGATTESKGSWSITSEQYFLPPYAGVYFISFHYKGTAGRLIAFVYRGNGEVFRGSSDSQFPNGINYGASASGIVRIPDLSTSSRISFRMLMSGATENPSDFVCQMIRLGPA